MNTNVFAIFLVCSSIHSFDDTQDDFRKHYGLSYFEECKDYPKIFKCLAACRSMGFRIFRMNRSCKCTCHEMKTTTILPFFIPKTNVTRQMPLTFSPSLYHVVGTLSPATDIVTDLPDSTVSTDPCGVGKSTDKSTDNSTDNSTDIGIDNSTNSGTDNVTDSGTDSGDASNTTDHTNTDNVNTNNSGTEATTNVPE